MPAGMFDDTPDTRNRLRQDDKLRAVARALNLKPDWCGVCGREFDNHRVRHMFSSSGGIHTRDLTTPEGSSALVDAMVALEEIKYWMVGWSEEDGDLITAIFETGPGVHEHHEAHDPDRHVAILKAAYEALKAMGRIKE